MKTLISGLIVIFILTVLGVVGMWQRSISLQFQADMTKAVLEASSAEESIHRARIVYGLHADKLPIDFVSKVEKLYKR